MTGPDADAYIGLDFGTSGLKGVALAPSGDIIARASAPYPTHRPVAGSAEQAPRDWVTAAAAVTRQLRGTVPARRWRGMGLSAMIPTLVTAGPGGDPVGPAVTWQDSRADDHGAELRKRCGADDLYRVTGQWVDGRYLLPMFLRVATEPGRASAARWLLAAKDYLFGWLTGELVTDPSTAAGFGCYDLAAGGWSGRVLAGAAGMLAHAGGATSPPLPSLPPIMASSTWRLLRPQAAARLGCGQIPVCLGAADSVLGALGLGASQPGQVACIAGTSNVILAVAGQPLLDPAHRFLVTPLAEPGAWGLEMDLLATGSAIGWLARLLGGGQDEAALTALAAATDPRDAPIVLPYLSPGEQGALWDPQLHGTFTGVRLDHGPRHLARGLLNGIVLESRRCLSVLGAAGGFGTELRAGGGSAADPGFRADLADASRWRVRAPASHHADFSARGAARLAALAIDGHRLPDHDAGPVTSPDPDRARIWDQLWVDYEQARSAISGYYHAAAGAPVSPAGGPPSAAAGRDHGQRPGARGTR